MVSIELIENYRAVSEQLMVRSAGSSEQFQGSFRAVSVESYRDYGAIPEQLTARSTGSSLLEQFNNCFNQIRSELWSNFRAVDDTFNWQLRAIPEQLMVDSTGSSEQF